MAMFCTYPFHTQTPTRSGASISLRGHCSTVTSNHPWHHHMPLTNHPPFQHLRLPKSSLFQAPTAFQCPGSVAVPPTARNFDTRKPPMRHDRHLRWPEFTRPLTAKSTFSSEKAKKPPPVQRLALNFQTTLFDFYSSRPLFHIILSSRCFAVRSPGATTA